MKKLILLLIVAIVIVALTGFNKADAQTAKNPGEAFIQQASFDHNDAVKQFTGDFVTLFEMDFDAFNESGENSNTAIVNQYGNDNTTGITQNGWGNKALVNLLGDNNSTGLVQSGTDNQFILNLEGNSNAVNGEQLGSQNKLRMDLIGTGSNQTFTQMGNNLTIELIDSGTGGVPLQIEQRGDGAAVTVQNY